MGMSMHAVGFVPADDNWKKMLAVWDSCRAAGVAPPSDVLEFFGHVYPDGAAGAEVDLSKAMRKWTDGDMREGIEVELSKLLPNVTLIRFYCSW